MTIQQSPRDFFDERADSYVELSRWATDKGLGDATTDMLRDLPIRRLVDVGSGTGILLAQLNHIRQKIAVDISLSMLLANQDGVVQRVVADAHQLPLRSGSTDLVICRQVLHYCRPVELMAEAHRIMHPAAFLHVVQVTDYDEVPEWWYQYWTGLRGVAGRNHINRRQLLQYAGDTGFTVAREESYSLRAEGISWEGFFRKNRVTPDRQKEVKDFFYQAPPEVARCYQLDVDDTGLSYTRRFSLFLFRPI